MDDANFTTKTAIAALLKLYAQIKWTEEIIATKDNLKSGNPTSFFDKVFDSQMNKAIKDTDRHYQR